MEDKRIVALFWARDERALTVVREKYGHLCRSIAYNLLGDEQDTEECENDAYLAAWNGIPPASPDSLAAWLGRVTRNLAVNRFHARNAQKRSGELVELLPELCDVVGDTTEDAFDRAHVLALVTAFLKEETDDYRWLFLRRYWYGDSIAALAEASGCGESTVKMRLARQRARLRTYLQEEGVSV